MFSTKTYGVNIVRLQRWGSIPELAFDKDWTEIHMYLNTHHKARRVMVCVSLSGLRDSQVAGKTLFLGVSVRVFPKEINTGTCRLSSQMWVSITQSTESLNRTQRWKKGEFALFGELGHPSSPALGRRRSWFSGLWTQIELYYQLPCFFSLQTADCGTSQPP